MRLPDRLKLPFAFDAAALAADVNALGEEAWHKHFNTRYYEGDWSGVPLRTPHGRLTILPDPAGIEPYEDTSLLPACPAVGDLLAALPCATTSVRFLRLGPGARIREHRDYNIGLDFGEVRLHVPIVTGPGVEFVLNGLPLHMKPAECWFVDVSGPHSVVNPGPTTRVHLVIDCVVNDALSTLLDEAARALNDDFARFRERVAHDGALADALWEQQESADFVALAVRLAAEHALTIDEDDVRAAIAAGRQHWLERVNG